MDEYYEYGVKRPAPLKGVISNSGPHMSEDEATRIAAHLANSNPDVGPWKVVKRKRTVGDWED